jgi:hypothetical protein
MQDPLVAMRTFEILGIGEVFRHLFPTGQRIHAL